VPPADCLSFPHIIHAAVSLTSGALFFAVAVLLVCGSVACSHAQRSCARPTLDATCTPAVLHSHHACTPAPPSQVLGDHELEPMSKSWLGAPHSMCELRSLLCKTLITVADILFKPLPRMQTVMYIFACGLLFYYHARMVSGEG
jgi:hypothetical protein